MSNRNAKESLINKVNNSENSNKNNNAYPENSSRHADTIKMDKYQAKGKINKAKQGGFFFFKLSRIGQIMLCIFLVAFIGFGFLFANHLINRGVPTMGERPEVAKVITNEQISEVKSALEEKISSDAINVDYIAYRFVVTMDLKDGTNSKDGRKANVAAYKIINSILPIDEYFSSADKLNNDLYIYSADIIPTNYDQKSKYIYETYKNSKMKSPQSYDLLKARDKKSYNEVIETMKDSQN